MDNPLRDLTLGQTFAWIAKHFGDDGLRYSLSKEAFDRVNRAWPVGWQEPHLQAAGELEALGLAEPAKIVREYAEMLPSLDDDNNCPYLEPPYINTPGNQNNIKAWKAYISRNSRKAS